MLKNDSRNVLVQIRAFHVTFGIMSFFLSIPYFTPDTVLDQDTSIIPLGMVAIS